MASGILQRSFGILNTIASACLTHPEAISDVTGIYTPSTKKKAKEYPEMTQEQVASNIRSGLGSLKSRQDLTEAEIFKALEEAARNMTCRLHETRTVEVANTWLMKIQERGCQFQFIELDQNHATFGYQEDMSASQQSYPYQSTTTMTSTTLTNELAQASLFSTPPRTHQDSSAPSVSPPSIGRYANPASQVSEVSDSSLEHGSTSCPSHLKVEPELPVNTANLAFTTTRVEEIKVR
jgi:hypothetical protein